MSQFYDGFHICFSSEGSNRSQLTLISLSVTKNVSKTKFMNLFGIIFFLIYFFYFFIFWLRWVFVAAHGPSLVVTRGAALSCGVWASHCVASPVAEHELQAHGLQQLWHSGSVVVACRLQSTASVVVAHGLSCSMACGIFLDQGSNPCPLHWQADSQPLRHQEALFGIILLYFPAVKFSSN